jgi:pilus assembly protein CpaF
MLAAMNTGHEGSLSTVHANSPPDALRRLEVMATGGGPALPLTVVREHIAAAVDVVVQVARTDGDTRRIVAIDEVVSQRGVGDPVATRPLVRGSDVVAQPSRWRRPDPVDDW